MTSAPTVTTFVLTFPSITGACIAAIALTYSCGASGSPTRMEMNATQEWYLVGVRANDLNGLRVRI